MTGFDKVSSDTFYLDADNIQQISEMLSDSATLNVRKIEIDAGVDTIVIAGNQDNGVSVSLAKEDDPV